MTESTPLEELATLSSGDFMQPEIFLGADLDQEILAGLDWEESGHYCRLSASGFLDCTDWHGPFETLAGAAQELIDSYYD